MRDAVRVMVVDDHAMFVEALGLLFSKQPGFELVGRAVTGSEAVEMAIAERPDVVLMDLDLPDMDGLEATRRIRAGCARTRVVVFTALQGADVIAASLAAGACGYVPKTRAVEEMIDIVRRAALGEIVMPDADLSLVVEQLQMGRQPVPVAEFALRRLTARETEILRALAAGDSTVAIAASLGISPLTVQSHVKSILSKLGVHSKIEAVTMAWRHGLASATRTA